MNCRPGELCVIVRSRCGNEGRLVTCLSLATMAELEAAFGFIRVRGPIWRLDTPVRWENPVLGKKMAPYMDDCAMRPIRDQDGEDEMLRIAGKPKELERA